MGKGARNRQARRVEVAVAPRPVTSAERNTRVLMIGAPLLAAIIIIVLLVALSSGSGSAPHKVKDVKGRAAAKSLLGGITQRALALGSATAPVQIHEFADLQCPLCRQFDSSSAPDVIRSLVKTGEAQLVYEPLPVLGGDSTTAARSLEAAADQGKGWQFLTLFYANQGDENSGYVTTPFLDSIAGAAGLNMTQYHHDLKANAHIYNTEIDTAKAAAKGYGFTGTPSFRIIGPKGTRELTKLPNAAAISAAVAAVKG
jgi:protein-disulfide isomerase